jgi:excisionase family DNA binding protein
VLFPQARRVNHSQPHATGGRVAVVNAPPRFLQLADVAEILNISGAQVYALVRRGELRAIKIGGRGQWRVEASELEAYIERAYADADKFVDDHPFVEGSSVAKD